MCALLMVVSATGLALLAGRESASMPALLLVHLGAVGGVEGGREVERLQLGRDLARVLRARGEGRHPGSERDEADAENDPADQDDPDESRETVRRLHG